MRTTVCSRERKRGEAESENERGGETQRRWEREKTSDRGERKVRIKKY